MASPQDSRVLLLLETLSDGSKQSHRANPAVPMWSACGIRGGLGEPAFSYARPTCQACRKIDEHYGVGLT